MHCIVRRTNLVALTFLNMPIVVKIEALLASVYTYFNHSPKRNLERLKLVEVMETKDFKNFEQHQNQMDQHDCSKQGGP